MVRAVLATREAVHRGAVVALAVATDDTENVIEVDTHLVVSTARRWPHDGACSMADGCVLA